MKQMIKIVNGKITNVLLEDVIKIKMKMIVMKNMIVYMIMTNAINVVIIRM